MSILAEVLTYLASQGIGVIGTTLFKGRMPAAPTGDTAVWTAIYEYGGDPPRTGFGTPGLQVEYPGLHIEVRGAVNDYDGPRAKMEAIYQLLPKLQAAVLSGTKYRIVLPQQAPFPIEPPEATNRFRFAVNFIVEKEPSAA